MKRANNALRRSSIKLKSLSSGNADLQLIISQIKDVKYSFKLFMDAQEVLAEDLYSWSQKLENEAIQSTFSYMLQISTLWTEAQKFFYETLRRYKEEFELILEGDKHVSQAKKFVENHEELEVKAKKELQKGSKKSSLQEVEVLRAKVTQAEKNKEAARLDFSEKLRENEAVRMIIVKGSTMKLGAAYHEMTTKGCSLFHAHHLVAQEIPDVHGKELHNVRYRANACKDHLKRAEEQIMCYRRDAIKHPNISGPSNLSSHTTNRSNDSERSHSHPPTAPTPSIASSTSSISISSTSNIYPNIDNAQLNNLDIDRSNEKFHYGKMIDPRRPSRDSRRNDGLEPASANNSSGQYTPPPFNPYFTMDRSK